MRRRSLAAATLLAVATIASVAVWELRPEPPPLAPAPVRSDYTLENFELTALDQEGKESFSVTAPHLERDPAGKSLTLRLPQFSFPDKEGGRWLATSNSAWVAEKGVEVRLIDKVEMTGPPSPLGERAQFKTRLLNVFPKQDLALTDEQVTMTQGDSILSGTGLRADMRAHRIQLLANVKGRYAPARR